MNSRLAAREADQDPNVSAEQLIETANRLLHRQFIARSDAGGSTHFERVKLHLDYYRDLFASFGFRFIFNDAWGYVGYVSPAAFNNARVPVQETILLLCLKQLYSEGAEKGYFVDGGAGILVDEEEIQALYSSVGQRKLKAGELREILLTFRRQGLVQFDPSHPINISIELTIRPTINEVVDESYVARLQAWGQGASNDPLDEVEGDPIALENLQTIEDS